MCRLSSWSVRLRPCHGRRLLSSDQRVSTTSPDGPLHRGYGVGRDVGVEPTGFRCVLGEVRGVGHSTRGKVRSVEEGTCDS